MLSAPITTYLFLFRKRKRQQRSSLLYVKTDVTGSPLQYHNDSPILRRPLSALLMWKSALLIFLLSAPTFLSGGSRCQLFFIWKLVLSAFAYTSSFFIILVAINASPSSGRRTLRSALFHPEGIVICPSPFPFTFFNSVNGSGSRDTPFSM